MKKVKIQGLTLFIIRLIFFLTPGLYIPGYAATSIDNLPYIINSSGEYQISQDLSISSGTGITIDADNVTLSGTGTETNIFYSVSGSGTAIEISGSRENIQIRNLTLYQEGIYLNSKGITGSSLQSFVADNVTIHVKSGVSAAGFGFDVSGDSNSHIQNCSLNISGQSRFYGIDNPSNLKIHDCTFSVSDHSNPSQYPYVIYNPSSSEIYNNRFDINGAKVNVFGSWGGDNNLIYGNTINYNCTDGGRIFLMNGGADGWEIYNNTIIVTSNTAESQYVLRIRGIDGRSADNNLFHHNTVDITGASGQIAAVSLGDNSPMYGNKIYGNLLKSNSNIVNFYSSNVNDTEIFCNDIQAQGDAYPIAISYRTPSNVRIFNNTLSSERTDGKLVYVTSPATGVTFCDSDISGSDLSGGGSVNINPEVCQPDICSGLTGTIDNDLNLQIKEYSLSQNYPNPFNPATTIKYSIPASRLPRRSEAKTGRQYAAGSQNNQSFNQPITESNSDLLIVQLKVYNILGKEVATLVNDSQRPGIYEVQWDAGHLSSGVYFYQLRAGNFVQVKKLMLIK